MSKTVSFSMADLEYHMIEFEAHTKGLTPSQYCKMAAFSHTNKYASKGVFVELHKIVGETDKGREEPTFVGSRDK